MRKPKTNQLSIFILFMKFDIYPFFRPTMVSRKPQLTAKFALLPLWLRQVNQFGWLAATAQAPKRSITSNKGKCFIPKLPSHPTDFSLYPKFFSKYGRSFRVKKRKFLSGWRFLSFRRNLPSILYKVPLPVWPV